VLSLSVLKKLQVSLYRVKEEVKSPIGEKLLRDQFNKELRQVAFLDGININKLSRPLQVKINRFLDKRKERKKKDKRRKNQHNSEIMQT
jgi:hypothetical protein